MSKLGVAWPTDGQMGQSPACSGSGGQQPPQQKLGDAAVAQQEQQQAECQELAVRWRHKYWSALQACESRCQALLSDAQAVCKS